MENNGEIPSAYENFDRGDVESKKTSPKGKKIFIVSAIIIAVFVVLGSVFLSINLSGSDTDDKPLGKRVEVEGVDSKTLEVDSDWLSRKKRERAERRAAEERAEQEAAIALQKRLEKEAAEKARRDSEIANNPVNLPQPVNEPEPKPVPVLVQENTQNSKPPTPEQRKMMGGVMINHTSTSAENNELGGTEYNESYTSQSFKKGTAYRRSEELMNFLLIHGTNIPCFLYQQIISDYGAQITCRVSQDVYSANGRFLLVERGSTVTGEQTVELQPGKSRVFTTWRDIETPNGVSITIDSLGTGKLGAAGHEVWVDNHYPERFGGAILLSFVDDAFNALANTTSSNGSEISFESSTNTAEGIAEKALESSINISPTGYSKLGQRINILVARDIDMSSVYGVTYE